MLLRNNIEQSLVRNNSQDLDNLLENEVNNTIVPRIIDLPVFSMLEQHQDFKDAIIEIIKNYFNDESPIWWTMYESNRPVSQANVLSEYDTDLLASIIILFMIIVKKDNFKILWIYH